MTNKCSLDVETLKLHFDYFFSLKYDAIVEIFDVITKKYVLYHTDCMLSNLLPFCICIFSQNNQSNKPPTIKRQKNAKFFPYFLHFSECIRKRSTTTHSVVVIEFLSFLLIQKFYIIGLKLHYICLNAHDTVSYHH